MEVRCTGRKLRTQRDGDFFGEIALITETPRSATIVATAPVRLLVITGQSFQRLMSETPSIQGKVLVALAQRLAPALV